MSAEQQGTYGQGREALIRAAVEVAAVRGLRGMTFRAVAEAAGVNNALIAHHFRNREGLLLAALDWATENLIRTTSLSKSTTEPEAFQQAVEAVVEADRNVMVFQYELILEASRNERFRPKVVELYRAYTQGMMPESVEITPLTRARFAAIDGLVLQLVSGAISHEEFEESLRAILRQVGVSAGAA